MEVNERWLVLTTQLVVLFHFFRRVSSYKNLSIIYVNSVTVNICIISAEGSGSSKRDLPLPTD